MGDMAGLSFSHLLPILVQSTHFQYHKDQERLRSLETGKSGNWNYVLNGHGALLHTCGCGTKIMFVGWRWNCSPCHFQNGTNLTLSSCFSHLLALRISVDPGWSGSIYWHQLAHMEQEAVGEGEGRHNLKDTWVLHRATQLKNLIHTLLSNPHFVSSKPARPSVNVSSKQRRHCVLCCRSVMTNVISLATGLLPCLPCFLRAAPWSCSPSQQCPGSPYRY
jgi:hypothetical protein